MTNPPPFLRDRYNWAAAAVFAVSCWFCLWNLDYAKFWHDEIEAALMGRALLLQGDITGWDGRNLYATGGGDPLNADLRNIYPPLGFFVTAAGFALFGINETGGRIPHAIIGLAAFVLFYFLLRRQLPQHPRLVLLAFTFAALSVQLILFFRNARYYSTMLLLFIALFYFYEKYWERKNPAWLAAMTAASALAFLNHYISGAAMVGALALWHLLFRARETRARQWIQFAACGAVFLTCSLGYAFWIGAIGSGYQFGVGYEHGPVVRRLLLLYFHFRELFRVDWVSWPVFLWFAWMLILRADKYFSADKKKKRRGRKPPSPPPEDDPLPPAALRLMVYATLLLSITAMLSQQPPSKQTFADFRYHIAALPFLLIMKAMFVNWLWTRRQAWGKPAAGLAAAVLLLSNAGAWPFIFPNHFGDPNSDGIQPQLIKFAAEIIHGDYEESHEAAARFLLQHAKQDEVLMVPWWPAQGVMQFYVGGHMRICCHLDAGAKNPLLPIEKGRKLGEHLYFTQNSSPDWVVHFQNELDENYFAQFKDVNIQKITLPNFYYPTQRPEIYAHSFRPLVVGEGGPGTFIYRLTPRAPPPDGQ